MGTLNGFVSESQNMTSNVKEKETNRNCPETQDENVLICISQPS